MPAVPPPELADLARLSTGDGDPGAVLRRIVRHAVSLVPGCVAAGLTVRSPEGERSAEVSDDRVRPCHDVQFSGAGGPAQETLRRAEPRRVDDLGGDDRWPEFAAVARAQGFGSCLALPLRSSRSWSSALNLYAEDPEVFSGTPLDVALLFAAQGGVALDNADLYRQSLATVEHLHHTLTTRSLIERAKGLLMSRYGLGGDEAFAALRQESQHSDRKLRDVAFDVVRRHDPAGAEEEPPWTPPRRPSALRE